MLGGGGGGAGCLVNIPWLCLVCVRICLYMVRVYIHLQVLESKSKSKKCLFVVDKNTTKTLVTDTIKST